MKYLFNKPTAQCIILLFLAFTCWQLWVKLSAAASRAAWRHFFNQPEPSAQPLQNLRLVGSHSDDLQITYDGTGATLELVDGSTTAANTPNITVDTDGKITAAASGAPPDSAQQKETIFIFNTGYSLPQCWHVDNDQLEWLKDVAPTGLSFLLANNKHPAGMACPVCLK